MSESRPYIQPPSETYDDDVLYGARREATILVELSKLGNDSECVLHAIGTFAEKKQWTLKDLIGTDARLVEMTNKANITHAYPIQRYCWPHIDRGTFPLVCVSPESTGKTMTHLLYIVSKCISGLSIARTDELIKGCSQSAVFDPTAELSTEHQKKAIAQKVEDFSHVDQDTFDFDSLGKSDHENGTTGSTADVKQSHTVSQSDSLDTNHESNGSQQKKNSWDMANDEFQVAADDFITNPYHIIICSSQVQVELIDREIDRLKQTIYGQRVSIAKCKTLPPKVSIVNVHQSEETLALRCSGCEILIATPGALVKCLQANYVSFAKTKKIIFDDLDLTLQLHNFKVREIIKSFLAQTSVPHTDAGANSNACVDAAGACEANHDRDYGEENKHENGGDDDDDGFDCQIYAFSRKWTDLVKLFVNTVLPQRTLIFGSLIEASLYADIRFELEFYNNPVSRFDKLCNVVRQWILGGKFDEDLIVVCRNCDEARETAKALVDSGIQAKFVSETFNLCQKQRTNCLKWDPILVVSDAAVEFIVDTINYMTHVVHYSLPSEMLMFDQRFRLMYQHIRAVKRSLTTTIFLTHPTNARHVKYLYDMISRSSSSMHSTKLSLRDFISETSQSICWRWASTGVCRLEKFSREDRLGSYCLEKHSLSDREPCFESEWPNGGQFKITITHLISPNEFYFWFEAHRDRDSVEKRWTNFEYSGLGFMRKLQEKLQLYKDSPPCSVPLTSFRKGKIYGIYQQQEARVDRIMLLEQPEVKTAAQISSVKKGSIMARLAQLNLGYEYSKQVEVVKIDYGVVLSVYLKNIFEISPKLASLKPQCHRGFHIGVKPTENEPNWLYKPKKAFYEMICANNLYEITVWHRLQSGGCFWFENMIVKQKCHKIDDTEIIQSEPHAELIQAGLATRAHPPPSFLNPSERLQTLSKWHAQRLNELVQYAFLRSDQDFSNLFVLYINTNYDLRVRNVDFKKQLDELESKIHEDYVNNRLTPLSYFAEGCFCIALIEFGIDSETRKQNFTLNRCRINQLREKAIEESSSKACSEGSYETVYRVSCLDHGDIYDVEARHLFQCEPDYLSRLPFQAITCRLADFNEAILDESAEKKLEILNHLFNLTRDAEENLVELKCKLGKSPNEIYIYLPSENNLYIPLISLFEQRYNISLCKDPSPELRRSIEIAAPPTELEGDNIQASIVHLVIRGVLQELIEQELAAARPHQL